MHDAVPDVLPATDPAAREHFIADLLNGSPPPPAPRDVRDTSQAAQLIGNMLHRRIRAVTSRFSGHQGVLLSGGVDSMLVLAALVEAGHKPVATTFTATSDGRPLGTDNNAARQCAAAFGVEHLQVTVDATQLAAATRPVVQALNTDDIWEVGAGLPVQACTSALTDHGVDGAWWTGGGADIMFAGGQQLAADPTGAAAVTELDTLIDRHVATKTTHDKPIPDFFERLLGNDAGRYILTMTTTDTWTTSRRLHPQVLFDGTHDKVALRTLAEQLGVPKHLAWRPKDPLQRSSGLLDAFELAARHAAAETAKRYSDPTTEPAGHVAARLWLRTTTN